VRRCDWRRGCWSGDAEVFIKSLEEIEEVAVDM
jgi:hypothetical protein